MFSARLKLISYPSREKQDRDPPGKRMPEPGSLGSHRGHLRLTATPRGLLQLLGHRLLRARLCPSIVLLEAHCKKQCGCWQQLQLALATRQGLARVQAWLPWHWTDRQTVILPLVTSALSWKICKWTTLTPQPQDGEMTTHFLTEVLQPFCFSLSNAKSVHLEPEHWTRKKENGKALLKVDYIYFSTHPPVADVSTEKGILLPFLSP